MASVSRMASSQQNAGRSTYRLQVDGAVSMTRLIGPRGQWRGKGKERACSAAVAPVQRGEPWAILQLKLGMTLLATSSHSHAAPVSDVTEEREQLREQHHGQQHVPIGVHAPQARRSGERVLCEQGVLITNLR